MRSIAYVLAATVVGLGLGSANWAAAEEAHHPENGDQTPETEAGPKDVPSKGEGAAAGSASGGGMGMMQGGMMRQGGKGMMQGRMMGHGSSPIVVINIFPGGEMAMSGMGMMDRGGMGMMGKGGAGMMSQGEAGQAQQRRDMMQGRRMAMMSGAIDANRDGLISDDEAAARHEEAFARMDVDDDGVLTEEEYMAFVMVPKAQAGVQGPRHERMRAAKAERFKNLDRDGDGKVDKAEFMAAGKDKFEASDLDDDGKVTVWEFRSHRHL